MRHNLSFSSFLLVIFLITFSNCMAGTFNRSSSVTDKKFKNIMISDIPGMKDMPNHTVPVTKEEEPIKKTHSMKMEELAHIHHFHKERVKKIKRHHKKFWMLSKLLLILCHVLLLIGAYQHLLNE